jgi:hypothetical protein
MQVCNSTRAIVAAAAGVVVLLAAGSVGAATAKSHTERVCWRYSGGPRGGMWPAPCPQPEKKVVTAAAHGDKVCWRYYGGPKGGMWPGPCAE